MRSEKRESGCMRLRRWYCGRRRIRIRGRWSTWATSMLGRGRMWMGHSLQEMLGEQGSDARQWCPLKATERVVKVLCG